MTTKWKIEQLKRQGDTGLVVEVFYNVIVKESAYMANQKGKLTLTGDPNSENFVAFENLTEEIVIFLSKFKASSLLTSKGTESFNLLNHLPKSDL
jgi:hypothetical protein